MGNGYGETFMRDSKIRQRCRNFEADRTDVHDAGGQGWKRVLTDDFVPRLDQTIRENSRFTISVLSDSFPEISSRAFYIIALHIWRETLLF